MYHELISCPLGGRDLWNKQACSILMNKNKPEVERRIEQRVNMLKGDSEYSFRARGNLTLYI